MRKVIIAAVARNGVIGAEGGLPWHIPEDMARFKSITMGHALLMGRTTFESIGRPLPGRLNIVLTRQEGWAHEGVEIADSLEAGLAIAASRDVDAYIAGGAQVYQVALDVVDILDITEVDAVPDGDTWFPDVDWSRWREVSREPHPGFVFVTYDRIGPATGP